MNKSLKNESNVLTLEQILKEAATRPKMKYLYKGISLKSFGLIVGASKGGKTIFSENLAMSYACGISEYLGIKLGESKQKVLFLGLEEFWLNRANRNRKQLSTYSSEEQLLINKNYVVQDINFLTRIVKNKHWIKLEDLIKKSEAKLVIIDSITRLNHGSLEDSKTAEEIMYRLRSICSRNDITLICIHHTPKMINQPMTLDKIKGSSTFAQESDFAIGIGKTSRGDRYIKDLFYRYAPEDNETAQEFEIDENTILVHLKDTTENEILNRSDARRDDKSRDIIIEYFKCHSCKKLTTANLILELKKKLNLKERRIKSLLSELVAEKKINRISNGIYKSITCQEKEASDEEE